MSAVALFPDLFVRLRHATDAAHSRLEQDLDLLRTPLSRARFATVLERFLGFHRVWEPALALREALAPVLVGRDRVRLLEADLRRLGLTDEQVANVAPCEAAARLADPPAAGLGSLYVLEGSTLGGQLISRALADAEWAPPEGLGYFQPYGPQAGAKWRELKAWAATWPAEDHPEVERGALATFDLLHRWLTPGLAS